ncbi:MAG TPA: hypothetical protein VFY03_11605, partial [Woeseiaceae bacterium]|nr:hypothetical protein [Woeseiaceae bacterium]
QAANGSRFPAMTITLWQPAACKSRHYRRSYDRNDRNDRRWRIPRLHERPSGREWFAVSGHDDNA